jgi:hypothetical protein
MSDTEEALVPLTEVAVVGSLHLPEFWPDAPANWFIHANSKCCLKSFTSESDQYDHLVGGLHRSSNCLVLDILKQPDATTPYTSLKERLLSSHELTDFQKIERLFEMEALGPRKPFRASRRNARDLPQGAEETTCSSDSSSWNVF